MDAIRSVGIVGLGKMGAPMARHLLAAKFTVTGCDPSPAARSEAARLGVRVVDSAQQVAEASDLVLVVVGFEGEVDAAVFGERGIAAAAQPGLVVALGSTVAPRYARQLAERLAKKRMVLLDIPLARGEAAAVAGKLLVFGAGEEASFERCRPAFRAFASDIFHLGPAGAGQVGKMVNNLILWACTSANDEGLRLGEALGVEPARLR
jgi:3-hydroxyisobutyrate dehydrogenase-like beta-hydroxyacid dehydrogenase